MSVNRLNVLMTVMIAFAFLAAELGNAVNGHPKFNQRRLPQHLLNIPPKEYCGDELSNTLEIVCDRAYNSYEDNEQEEANTGHNFDYERKELEEAINSINFDYEDIQELDTIDLLSGFEYPPFMPRTKAKRMLDSLFTGRRFRRQSHGIHEECCLKKCTIYELYSYCADPYQ